MKKSYTKIYIHYIWATKNRQRILTKEVRKKAQDNAKELLFRPFMAFTEDIWL